MEPRVQWRRHSRTGAPWWTDADQAELNAILWEFVECARTHKRDCAACRTAMTGWCVPLAEAWDAVEGWIARRQLLSRAEWLRARQKVRDAA
jgi:hypothetical protein